MTIATKRLTEEQIRSFPPSAKFADTCAAFEISLSLGYDLVARGEFPCTVLKLGRTFKVPRAEILKVLGIEPLAEAV